MSSKCLWLTFRKISVNEKNLEGKKIGLVIETKANTYKPKSLRSVKNGIANFYGESFALPLETEEFSIVTEEEAKGHKSEIITQFVVKKQQIKELNSRKNIFTSQSKELKVTWQGQILDEDGQSVSQQSQRTQIDFEELEEQEHPQKQILNRHAYSPLIRRVPQKREKRRSFRLRNEETASEPPSESPYKFTLDTNDTENKVVKKKQNLQPIKKIHEREFDNSSSENQVHSIFKPKDSKHRKSQKKSKQAQKNKGFQSPLQSSSLKKKMNEKSRKSIFQRINLRSMVYTGVIGVISGLTATQL